MTFLEKAALGALLFAGTCAACHGGTSYVPMTLRPDTRKISFVRFDSVAMRQTMQILQAALPNESSVCYTGELYDSTYQAVDGPHLAKVIWLHSAREAVQDSATQYAVYYSRPLVGCQTGVIAIGHSHPYSGGGLCSHSPPDANVLFRAPSILLSFVWCGDGRVEILYQDGRRYESRWREP